MDGSFLIVMVDHCKKTTGLQVGAHLDYSTHTLYEAPSLINPPHQKREQPPIPWPRHQYKPAYKLSMDALMANRYVQIIL
jgi:hypothetical protein